ncbi:MAG: hypothetical protein V1792_14010 [Pseudomonadota bacterium]
MAFNKPQDTVKRYLSEKMNAELIHFLGRKPSERKEDEILYESFGEKALEAIWKHPCDKQLWKGSERSGRQLHGCRNRHALCENRSLEVEILTVSFCVTQTVETSTGYFVKESNNNVSIESF